MYITDRIEIQIRSGTGIEYRVLGRVKTGDRVEVLEGDRNWSKIKLSDGTGSQEVTVYNELADQVRGALAFYQAHRDEIEGMYATG